ncbi:hypothetical protein [Streptomyces sp. NPDC000618]|uniref:hypothetical protein n=1 Tax=Streptomyces sp. NPDC000618 TaxID=3154265 RepID=UPI00332B41AB
MWDVLPGAFGRVGGLRGHFQRGGDLQVGGVFQALHGDVGADVVEGLWFVEGGVEDLRLGEVGGSGARRGDEGDGRRAGFVDEVGEFPGGVRVQGGRAQQQVRLAPVFGRLVGFQEAFAQVV